MKSPLALSSFGVLVLCGCSCWDALTVRSQSPDEQKPSNASARLVGDLAVPYNMFPVKVEAVGLVVGLPGTGSDPPPSPQRAALVAEMQARGVNRPSAVLASPKTAMVLVRGVLRPGIQKGDRFDVELRVPSQSETTSLRGGRLLETRLTEMAVLDNQVHDGGLLAMADGPVLVDPGADSKKDPILACRGQILGGGVAVKSRPLGLVLKPEHKSVMNSAQIATAINRRFHGFQKGVQTSVAKAQTDEYVRLDVHPRYKDNIPRYIQVIRSVALRETPSECIERLAELEKRLIDPVTSAEAALQLEAIGPQGIEVLKKGIQSGSSEVRFYAAESLAYLDQSEAAAVLAEAARTEPAFRVFALGALSAMDDYRAYEQLSELLSASSAETRYGAFRALWTMNRNDALVMGENLGGQFSYHALNTAGPPMIHVTRSRRPEIVLFGQDQRLVPPLALEAGPHILVTASAPGEITISRFVAGQPDQKRVVSTKVDDVLRAVVELGGTYPDVIQALEQAQAHGALPGRFEVDALPEAGREYDRTSQATEKEGKASAADADTSPPHDQVATTGGLKSKESGSKQTDQENTPIDVDSPARAHPVRNFFARMTGRQPN